MFSAAGSLETRERVAEGGLGRQARQMQSLLCCVRHFRFHAGLWEAIQGHCVGRENI